ncbi:hypothetical protein [Mycobacterium sp. NPDC006124]|uniref:hypothetical protein n=1 Tax=Mycobacterium sp. NPDC006124 TaxID=3156729 RepID=UPI0033AF9660
MSAAPTKSFGSDRLDEMICGTVELSVPQRRGVILVGAGGPADVGRIRVSKERRTITVTRVDGLPMQVDVVDDDASSTRVFDTPIFALRLLRSNGRWLVVGNSIAAKRVCDVKRFADVVGTFAVAKQGRAQQAQRG